MRKNKSQLWQACLHHINKKTKFNQMQIKKKGNCDFLTPNSDFYPQNYKKKVWIVTNSKRKVKIVSKCKKNNNKKRTLNFYLQHKKVKKRTIRIWNILCCTKGLWAIKRNALEIIYYSNIIFTLWDAHSLGKH